MKSKKVYRAIFLKPYEAGKKLQIWCVFCLGMLCLQACVSLKSRRWESCSISPEDQLELSAFLGNALHTDASIAIDCAGEIYGKDYLTYLKGTIAADDATMASIRKSLLESDDYPLPSKTNTFEWFSPPISEPICHGYTPSGIQITCYKTNEPNARLIMLFFASDHFKSHDAVRQIIRD